MIVDEICKLYPMAKSQTASTKYAMSTLGFVDKRVCQPAIAVRMLGRFWTRQSSLQNL